MWRWAWLLLISGWKCSVFQTCWYLAKKYVWRALNLESICFDIDETETRFVSDMFCFKVVEWRFIILLLKTRLSLYAQASGTMSHDYYILQVVPGRAGGGSFRRKKNHIAKKEFAYRMCARWPTIAMSKLFLGLNEAFAVAWLWCHFALGWCVCDLTCFQAMWLVVRWFVVLLRYYSVLQRTTTDYSSTTPTHYSVLQRTTPGLLCATKNYSSTTLYYEVLLCTTKYYSSTTLYYKVLRQYYKVLRQYYSVLQSINYSSTTKYYSVLQSTALVLLCTTKYYARTTKYYASSRKYTPVLLSTTPVLLCTTTYYSSTNLYYNVLRQCYNVLPTTYYSSTTLYYKVLRQYYNVLLQYYSHKIAWFTKLPSFLGWRVFFRTKWREKM